MQKYGKHATYMFLACGRSWKRKAAVVRVNGRVSGLLRSSFRFRTELEEHLRLKVWRNSILSSRICGLEFSCCRWRHFLNFMNSDGRVEAVGGACERSTWTGNPVNTWPHVSAWRHSRRAASLKRTEPSEEPPRQRAIYTRDCYYLLLINDYIYI